MVEIAYLCKKLDYKQVEIMRIKDLPKFSFSIGFTISSNKLVTATNDGLVVDGEVVIEYGDYNVMDADDLIEEIDNAINDCKEFDDDDYEELSFLLYGNEGLNINVWWEVKV